MKFTEDNTEGYTSNQVAGFNAEWDKIEATLDPEDLDALKQAYNDFCDEVSRR